MNTLTVKDIKDRLQEVKDAQDPFIAQCENDPRKSVQTLVEQWLKKQAKEKALKEQWVNMTSYERLARNKGFRLIAGVDEVGRGPLAGPVVASAVILPEECEILGLTDSKKLSEKKREEYYELIMKEALAVGIGIVEATVIDEINIYEASKMAMVKAIQDLSDTPDYLLVDAMTLPLDTAQASIIKGDAKSVSIAAGACIAKVTRDRMMSAYAETYPMYGFEKIKAMGQKNIWKLLLHTAQLNCTAKLSLLFNLSDKSPWTRRHLFKMNIRNDVQKALQHLFGRTAVPQETSKVNEALNGEKRLLLGKVLRLLGDQHALIQVGNQTVQGKLETQLRPQAYYWFSYEKNGRTNRPSSGRSKL